MRLALSLSHLPCHRRKFAALRGVHLLHHLADSGQGFPADSQRGAIAKAIDARTPLRLAFPKPESTRREISLVQGKMMQQRTPTKGLRYESPRGAIAQAIDAKTLKRFACPKPESSRREISLVQGKMSCNEHRM